MKRYWIPLAGIVIGAIGGYLYFRLEGCSGGTCLITSRPLNSTLYGALMGGLLFSIFQPAKQKSPDDKKQTHE